MKKLLLLSAVLIFGLSSCSTPPASSPTEDVGVVINGIRWATRNVDAPGTFAARPEDPGMLFQWNRRVGWSSADPLIGSDGSTTWSGSRAGGTEWIRDNDPCPPGWRVPTIEELTALHNAGSEWVTQNDVRGRLFGTAPNRIFLPAVGARNHNGALNLTGAIGYYWSSSESAAGFAWFLRNVNIFSGVADYSRARGLSVRCVAID